MATAAQRGRALLRRVVRDLGPPPRPIRFRSDLGDVDHFACCDFDGDEFVIRLWRGFGDVGPADPTETPKLSHEVYVRRCAADEILIHELAHAYAWTAGAACRGDHDEIWGVMYARIYCATAGRH